MNIRFSRRNSHIPRHIPRHIFSHIILLVALFFSPSLVWADPSDSAPYARVVVFGDSLSDTGNLASLIGNFPSPPYYMNRVSNGPVAVEVLANKLYLDALPSLHLIGPAQGSNYAVAGARAGGSEFIDLGFQVTMFLANNSGAAPANFLYIVFIGGNDVRDARGEADQVTAMAIIDQAVAMEIAAIQNLVAAGASDILVVNVPDIGAIPESGLLAIALGQPALKEYASLLTRAYNKKLKKQLKVLKHQLNEVDIEQFDLFKFFGKLIKHANKYGFDNATDACFSSATLIVNPACNFENFVFFDEIHPTAHAHAIVGSRMSRLVLKNGEGHEEEHYLEIEIE
ncbi:MAG: SGNH/GDSL hydrolase family protein [Acidiferrobacterales bacterium]